MEPRSPVDSNTKHFFLWLEGIDRAALKNPNPDYMWMLLAALSARRSNSTVNRAGAVIVKNDRVSVRAFLCYRLT